MYILYILGKVNCIDHVRRKFKPCYGFGNEVWLVEQP